MTCLRIRLLTTLSGLTRATLLSVAALCPPALADTADPLPLAGKTSSLAFSTDEGSWVSLDVAPDGGSLVFDLLGDLYELPIDGGQASPLTSGLGYDSQPRISPDGKWIAFISDRDGANNLWLARRDGSDARQLSAEAQWPLISPSWSADSRYIIATRHGIDPELVFFHIDGGDGVTVAGQDSDEGPWGMGPVLSPDGRYIYYAGRANSTRPVDNFPTAQIFRHDRQTGASAQLTQGIGGGVRPLLSPDGRALVYATRQDGETGLRIRDLDSGDDRWLSYPVQRDAQENYLPPSRDLLPGYAFTPDGRAVIVNADNRLWRIEVDTGTRREIPFRADVALEVGPDLTAPYRLDDGDVTGTLLQTPALSPDGRRVAGSALTRIYLAALDGSAQPARLTDDNRGEYRPAWSPDGRWISYVSWSDREGGHIWRARSDGRGEPQRLTAAPAFYTDLVYSPDGQTLFALRGNAWQRQQTFSEFGGLRIPLELVTLPADGGAVTRIMDAGDARLPHFGPESDRIYLSDGDGLLSRTLDGRDPRRELAVTGPRGNRRSEEPPAAESLQISPDGRHALAFAGKQVWLLPMLRTGAEAPAIDLRAPALPRVQLTDTGADAYGWSDNGRLIWWSIGHSVFTRALTSISFGDDDAADDRTGASTESVASTGADGACNRDCNRDCKCEDPGGSAEEAGDRLAPRREDHAAVTRHDIRVTAPRYRPEGSLLLRNVNLIAMRGDSTAAMNRVEPAQDVLITAGRVAAIGPGGSLELPPGTDTLDLAGRYLLPGFIDTHAHWEFRTHDVLEPHTWSLAANLAYGVTTGLDVQTFTADYFAYRDLVETGQTIGQRALMTGPGIFGDTDFESYAAAHAYLRRYSDHYATHNIKAYMSGNRRQRQWIVLASQALGLMPTTEGAGDQRLDITHAIDGMHGNEHTLPDHPLGDDVVQLYARTRTAYTPTLIVQYNAESMREYFFTRSDIHDDPKLRRFYPANRLDELTERRPGWQREEEFRFRQAARDAARIQRAGGLVGVGGHAELQGLGYHWEMWAYAMGGMSPVEVLRAATIDGARITGVAEDLGSIEVGKIADLLILEENPLEDIRHSSSLDKVIANGRVFDAATLDEEWPKQRPFPPFWWWDLDPLVDQRSPGR